MQDSEINQYLNTDCSFILDNDKKMEGFISFHNFQDSYPLYYFVKLKDKSKFYNAFLDNKISLMETYCMPISISSIKHIEKISSFSSVTACYIYPFKKLFAALTGQPSYN